MTGLAERNISFAHLLPLIHGSEVLLHSSNITAVVRADTLSACAKSTAFVLFEIGTVTTFKAAQTPMVPSVARAMQNHTCAKALVLNAGYQTASTGAAAPSGFEQERDQGRLSICAFESVFARAPFTTNG